jgi:hypothetical protein
MTDPHAAGPWPDPPIPDLDSDGLMVPPWIKYPNLPRTSMGWRMGQGEAYRDDFDLWWSRQPRNIRLAARSKYPESVEWSGFWGGKFGP